MSNRLFETNSPYLLQHADNPVDWFPWGEEALGIAKNAGKPIFLSIGYAACHWCHVMAHESFEDPETAAIMNEHFVNIKVDREERPDIDNIYMTAVVSITGSGGWPLSVFLTPEGKPFYGGTYFPPTPRYRLPSFRELLLTIIRLWQEDRDKLYKSADDITRHLQKSQTLIQRDEVLAEDVLEKASFILAQSYDWDNGGWGRAPKFPQPMAILFLINRAAQGDHMALDIVKHALDSMSTGGLYDVLGGGFARYSTDDKWLVPHFEKMLYDNALLATAYLRAFLITKNSLYREICEKTLDFIIREMMRNGSSGSSDRDGIFSSLDADSEGIEGKYYLWTFDEIRDTLCYPDSNEACHNIIDKFRFFCDAYQITEEGNYEGQNILQRRNNDQFLSEKYNIPIDKVTEELSSMQQQLLEKRDKRIKPDIDDKVLTSWNSLALIAFAEASRYLRRDDYLHIAKNLAHFLLTQLKKESLVFRSWRNGQIQHIGYLEDHAALVLGLLEIYQSDPDPHWFSEAEDIAHIIMEQFRDAQGGLFDTRQDHDPLIIRPKDLQDNAIPSGNSLAALAFLKMHAFTGDINWREEAESALQIMQRLITEQPLAFSFWLISLDYALASIREVAVLGEPFSPSFEAMIQALWSSYRPYTVLAASSYPPSNNSPSLLRDKELIDGLPTAYICKSFVCKQPVHDIEEFIAQLDGFGR